MSKVKSIKLKNTAKDDVQTKSGSSEPLPITQPSLQNETRIVDESLILEATEDADMRSLEEVINSTSQETEQEHDQEQEQEQEQEQDPEQEHNQEHNQGHSHPEDFMPLPPDYIIRQQQIATYQMLSQFLLHQDKGIAEVLNDVRISIDCLTKSVLQLNKNLDKHFTESAKKK